MPGSCRGARSLRESKQGRVWHGNARWPRAKTGMHGHRRPGTPSRSSRTPQTPWMPLRCAVAWQTFG
eukprot:9684307-Lingulodinium_polyedra.AAC.1